MAGFHTELSRRFKAGNIAAKYIYINVGIFILLQLIMILFHLFMKKPSFISFIAIPSDPMLFLYRPWTVITYMFVHLDFFHILFNMLCLYWFGKIFLQFFTGRQLGGLYLLGGMAGAALFILAYNTFPYYKQLLATNMVGASAAVMAIIFAVSFYRKDYEISLLLIGRIKLIYIATGVFLIDILAITSDNAGGHLAHIGGALMGIIFAAQYQKGKDITTFINKLIDRTVIIFGHKPAFITGRRSRKSDKQKNQPETHYPETDDAYLRRKNKENQMIDSILDKLKQSGYDSLSSDEKKKLFDASRK